MIKPITLKIPGSSSDYAIKFCVTFSELEELLNKKIGKRSFLIVTDENVLPIAQKIPTVKKATKNGNIIALPTGENHKTWSSVETILDACFKQNLDRNSVIVAMGGGVVGDITGFAASIFMRGIKTIQCPTTLLGMVDASIGGKTGMNHSCGKNLIGTITQPEAIFECFEFLKTLPEMEIKNGLCEMIKHGIINNPNHFSALEKLSQGNIDDTFLENLKPLISDSVRIKSDIVQKDPNESQERMKLNLGHTFGHAIEKLSNYTVPHGQAVAIGCVMAANYALEHEICDDEVVDRIENIFHQFSIDTLCPFDESDIWKEMSHDKKSEGNMLNLILPTKIGNVVIEKVVMSEE